MAYVDELDTLRLKNPNELGHITEQDIGSSYDTYGGEDAMRSAIDQAVQNPYTANILQQRVGDIAEEFHLKLTLKEMIYKPTKKCWLMMTDTIQLAVYVLRWLDRNGLGDTEEK